MHISRSAKRVSDGQNARLTKWPRPAAEYATFCLRLPAALNGNAACVRMVGSKLQSKRFGVGHDRAAQRGTSRVVNNQFIDWQIFDC